LGSSEKHYHAVKFYSDENSLARTVARFIAEGIDNGQPGIVIATPSHSDTIARELATCGADVDELRRTGELQFLDARKALASFMVGPVPDAGLFKAHVGGVIEEICAGRTPCPIRAYGEMVDILWQDGNPDGAIRLEMLWNGLAQAYDFALLCGYAVGHFYKETSDPRYQDVCSQHTHVVGGTEEAALS
jgi:hypothetical protein